MPGAPIIPVGDRKRERFAEVLQDEITKRVQITDGDRIFELLTEIRDALLRLEAIAEEL